MGVVYLTIDQVLELHQMALELGGADGVRAMQLLASAVCQPQQSAFGDDAYSTIQEKAAAYGFFICMGHPFVDGNKRTAELALVTFLDLRAMS
jgi:death-on-curing protein